MATSLSSLVTGDGLACGIQLPVQAQSRIFVEDWETDAGPDELAAVARAADDAGLLYVGVCDHVAVPRDRASRMGTTWYDTMTTLGFLAAITDRVHLLSHVYVPALHHPLVGAKAACTLDRLSGGRAILGVGAGHVEGEFDALGVDLGRRGELLDEAVDVLRAAFADEFVTHDGEHYHADDLGVAPRPARDGGPPIWIGGSSDAALRRAAERGDGWLPQGTPRARMPAQIEALRAYRRELRNDDPIAIGAMCEPFYLGTPSWNVGDYTITGSAEHLADKLSEFAEMGVAHVQIRPRSRSVGEYVDQLEQFAAEVMPIVATVASGAGPGRG